MLEEELGAHGGSGGVAGPGAGDGHGPAAEEDADLAGAEGKAAVVHVYGLKIGPGGAVDDVGPERDLAEPLALHASDLREELTDGVELVHGDADEAEAVGLPEGTGAGVEPD